MRRLIHDAVINVALSDRRRSITGRRGADKHAAC